MIGAVSRALIVFLLTPLLFIAVYLPDTLAGIAAAGYPDHDELAIRAIIFAFSHAYMATLLGAIPAYLFMRWRHSMTAGLTIALFGAAYGGLLFFQYVPTFYTSLTQDGIALVANGSITAQGWRHILVGSLTHAGLGLLSGALFWLAAGKYLPRRTDAPATSKSDQRFQWGLSIIVLAVMLKAMASFVVPLGTTASAMIAWGIARPAPDRPPSLQQATLKIPLQERSAEKVVESLQNFAAIAGYTVRGGKYPGREAGYDVQMTLEHPSGVEISIYRAILPHIMSNNYDITFNTWQPNADWQSAAQVLQRRLKAELELEGTLVLRHPANPKNEG